METVSFRYRAATHSFADCELRLGNPLFRLSIEKGGGGGFARPVTPLHASNQANGNITKY